MSIQDYWLKIKLYLEAGVGEWGIAILVVLIAVSCFGLGRLSALLEEKTPINITEASSASLAIAPGGMYVGSKSGNQYYFPWCTNAQKIDASDEVWFQTEEAAQKAGYAPGKNCKGL